MYRISEELKEKLKCILQKIPLKIVLIKLSLKIITTLGLYFLPPQKKERKKYVVFSCKMIEKFYTLVEKHYSENSELCKILKPEV